MIPTLALVIVETESYALAEIALRESLKRTSPKQVLIFSDRDVGWNSDSVIRIEKIRSYADYNRIILSDLANHLQTDFALVIQFDGFVLNSSAWIPEFTRYDYIGAVWPPGHDVDGKILEQPLDGNGGFSLWSRRLVEGFAQHFDCVDYRVAEDVALCVGYRDYLVQNLGVRYAPVAVARQFSVELEKVRTLSAFGFHGLHYLPRVYGDAYVYLLNNLPKRVFASSTHFAALKHGFSRCTPQAWQYFKDFCRRVGLALEGEIKRFDDQSKNVRQ